MIGIICFNSLRYAQFVYKYTELFDRNDIPYEVVYWNREGDSKGLGDNWISYDKQINTFQPFYKKIVDFIGFTRFMYKTIKTRMYNKVIILTTQTAIPLFPILIKRYKGKYIYDYRDITYENIYFYKKMVNKLIDESYATAISSRGFIESKYLDTHDGKFIIAHNSRNLSFVNVKKTESSKIRIVYWGQVRQPEFNKKICDLFGNDDRFMLTYHGAGFHEDIRKYIEEKKYNNIYVTGAYQLNDIEKFASNTDFILNMYENDKQQQPAMTVKFYDAIKYRLPMLVTKGSYMAHVVQKYEIGLCVDLDEPGLLDIIFDEYIKNNKISYIEKYQEVLNSVNIDDKKFAEKILLFDREDL